MKEKFLLCTLLIVGGITVQSQNGSPYWSLAGNSNATINSKLGTTNYTPLILKTNNLSRVYVAPNGFVGIGTTSPTANLHVEGQTLLNIFVNTVVPGLQSGSGLIGYVKGQPTAAGQRLGYFLTGSQGGGTNPYNATGMVGYADGAWSSTSRPAYIAFETTKNGSMQRSEAMRIGSRGYVGIGVKNPVYRLHVQDSSVAIFAGGEGSSSWGLYATGGYTGIYSNSGNYGLFATGTNRGVYATGNVGVYGQTSYSLGDGVHGEGTGSASYGGYFSSVSSYGLYAYTQNSSSFAGYFSGTVYTNGTYQGSDKRLKKNIAGFTGAMSIIKKLQPKTYEYLTEGKMAEMNLPKGKHYGLIAQDLEQVLPDLVKETTQYPLRDSSVTARSSVASNAGLTFKAVNYTELIPILIKGMQEQDEKLQEIDSLKSELETLKSTVEQLKAMLSGNTNGFLSSTSLDVASPNPARGNTIIRYSIPMGSTSSKLIVLNMTGQVLKAYNLSGGAGQVNLNVSGLASGSYPCTLWVNGQATVSKQLVVVH